MVSRQPNRVKHKLKGGEGDTLLSSQWKISKNSLHFIPAMARVKLMKNIVSSRRQPHSPLDNVNTPYNPIRYHSCLAEQNSHQQYFRLLKGAPPGQEAVNHYISELSIEKAHNSKLADKQRKHLVMLEVNQL